MHWLPLVAMVIASALPFPQSPVPRLVAAMEPSKNSRHSGVPGNSHTNDSQDMVIDREKQSRSGGGLDTDSRLKDYSLFSVSAQEEQIPKGMEESDLLRNSLLSSVVTGELSGRDVYTGVHKPRTGGPVDQKPHSHPNQGKSTTQDHDILKESSSDHNRFNKEKETPASEYRNLQTEMSGSGEVKVLAETETMERKKEEKGEGGGQGRSRAAETSEELLMSGLALGRRGTREEDELLLLDSHPRVLFSSSPSPPKHPPLLLMLEAGLLAENEVGVEHSGTDGEMGELEDVTANRESYRNLLLGLSDPDKRTGSHSPVGDSTELVDSHRLRRSLEHSKRSREHSVCESTSYWVTNKTTAVDERMKTVTVLSEIQTQTGSVKQYFYETRCRGAGHRGAGPGLAGAGCLGVDKKQWVSECQTKQSFVRALTIDANNKKGWRWIRIDSSCVCVLLSRAGRHHRGDWGKG